MQDFTVILIVAFAAGYLISKAWRRLAGHGGGCSSCKSCGPDDSIKSRPLVNISNEPAKR